MKKVIVNSQDQLRFLEQSEITHCKSDNCYTTIYLDNNEEHIVCKSLTKLFKELDPLVFIRINQSYVINKNYIKLIDKKKKVVELNGNKQIPFTTTLSSLLNLIAQNAAVLLFLCVSI
ncbi:LytR/AlgR family response regulator transcription factor [Mucilaginibacter psychrotolerans]|uniref:LytTR family transcriptional regulator n=1 Tax=Mucilaginibacter psychrotolerans TaxID=1524096 RepID=A0A4Y8SAY4_9SPHI|nr:LytTR family DNA-binding domain-containing protein [Mucilaginibacter psychrotolerans]TFF36138.1 LytTR family transcriptional regulator [Mucilaginibacter psychrotolerans]